MSDNLHHILHCPGDDNRSTGPLGLNPIFHDTVTNRASTRILDLIAGRPCEIDPTGLQNYLDFGYSIPGSSPIQGIALLPANTRIESWDEADPKSEADCLLPLLQSESQPNQLIEYTSFIFHTISECTTNDHVVLPLSGGLDSRLCALHLNNLNNIEAVTYGSSHPQQLSTEVLRAKEVCARVGLPWRRIELKDAHQHLEHWYTDYSCSTHAHGMYHYEFFSQLGPMPERTTLVSGIFGDAWTGNVSPATVESTEDLPSLGYSHGLSTGCAGLHQELLEDRRERLKPLHTLLKPLLNDSRLRIVALARLKAVLLSYLIRAPCRFGMRTATPFLDPEWLTRALSLPDDQRHGRQWQQEWLAKHNLSDRQLPNRGIAGQHLNSHFTVRNCPPPLSPDTLAKWFRRDYVNWINRSIIDIHRSGKAKTLTDSLICRRGIGRVLRRIGFKERDLRAYNAYLCLYPIEQVARKIQECG